MFVETSYDLSWTLHSIEFLVCFLFSAFVLQFLSVISRFFFKSERKKESGLQFAFSEPFLCFLPFSLRKQIGRAHV